MTDPSFKQKLQALVEASTKGPSGRFHDTLNRPETDGGIAPKVLRACLSYDANNGALTWKERPERDFRDSRTHRWWNSRYSGRPAFTCTKMHGYKVGKINDVLVLAHRAAWAIHYGEWPKGILDHINGDPADNRICNLRLSDHSANGKNSKRPSRNTSGVVGVTQCAKTGMWHAQIVSQKQRYFLGSFHNIQDAARARKNAERKFGFHQNHGRASNG